MIEKGIDVRLGRTSDKVGIGIDRLGLGCWKEAEAYPAATDQTNGQNNADQGAG